MDLHCGERAAEGKLLGEDFVPPLSDRGQKGKDQDDGRDD
jgi:hypothetical protein